MASRTRTTNWLMTRLPSYVVLTVIALISMFPFYWMVVGATNTSTDIINGR